MAHKSGETRKIVKIHIHTLLYDHFYYMRFGLSLSSRDDALLRGTPLYAEYYIYMIIILSIFM